MLVLSRRQGESLQIAGGIRVTVVRVQGMRVKLGIDAPEEVAIVRSEVLSDQEIAPDEAQTPR